MFRGQFTYSIDTKGRISIPAKLRKQISPEANDSFVITQGTGTCIDIYPLNEWQQIEERLLKLNSFTPDDSLFIRMMLQHATEDTMDSQSRILIPQPLIEYAKIDKDVLILGVLKKIEIWNPQIYQNYISQTKESYEQIAAKVMTIK
ncbi:MAG: division/cell wall cluster transcriptional repressor MraZ [Ignavibacteriales bacterium]|nr:MAG: division/cell wall cluster transcriptional repressor MraZ [Ignavibacteriales bacterium]